MKSRTHLIASFLLAAAFAAAPVLTGAGAVCLPEFQQGIGKGPITAPRDPELEKQSYHSLEVAKFYYYKRKPDKNDKAGWDRINKSVESRLTEIMDTNPTFARMDEVFFLLGEVYNRMGEGEKASDHWAKALKETSDDKVKSESQKRLDEAKSKAKK